MLTEGNVCANVCESVLTLIAKDGARRLEDLSDGHPDMLA
jgi:hypothetical protein